MLHAKNKNNAVAQDIIDANTQKRLNWWARWVSISLKLPPGGSHGGGFSLDKCFQNKSTDKSVWGEVTLNVKKDINNGASSKSSPEKWPFRPQCNSRTCLDPHPAPPGGVHISEWWMAPRHALPFTCVRQHWQWWGVSLPWRRHHQQPLQRGKKMRVRNTKGRKDGEKTSDKKQRVLFY